jgi:chromosome segregation ATPase
MAKAMRSRSSGGPFDKITDMISDMIEKLQKEGAEAAKKKAYCDKEMGSTKAKKEDAQDDLERLNTKVEKASSRRQRLKGDVKELESEELKLTKSMDEMQKLYTKDKAEYEKIIPETEAGLAGVQKAIKVLRDYYSNKDDIDKTSSANVIIGMLEEEESKLSKSLMDVKATRAPMSATTSNSRSRARPTWRQKRPRRSTRNGARRNSARSEIFSGRTGILKRSNWMRCPHTMPSSRRSASPSPTLSRSVPSGVRRRSRV